MFNMGFTELVILGVIGLIVIGPKQLPAVARTVARLLNEFKQATSDITDTLTQYKDETMKNIPDPMEMFDDFAKEAENEHKKNEIDDSNQSEPDKGKHDK